MNCMENQNAPTIGGRSSQDLCRMSWFLIEIDEGIYNGGSASGRTSCCTIHAVDLIDDDMSDMYISRRVKFSQQQAVLEGKVLLASDDRRYVEQQMSSMQQQLQQGMLPQQSTRYFLVQYQRNNNNSNSLLHAVIREQDVSWPLCDLAQQRELIIKDGQTQRLAAVLHTELQESILLEELQKLKSKCFEQAFDDADEQTDMHAELWLLLQHSCNPKTVAYSIVQYSDTVWHADNLYPDVVAYLSDDATIYQCIIIRKSACRSELEAQLHQLKDSAVAAHFPQQQAPPFLWSNGVQLQVMQQVAREQAAMDDELEHLDKQMQREVTMLADAFEAIEHARQNMEKRLFLLNNQ